MHVTEYRVTQKLALMLVEQYRYDQSIHSAPVEGNRFCVP